MKLLQKANRIYFFSFFLSVCVNNLLISSGIQKNKFKSELENSSNLLSLSNGLLLLFRVGVGVCDCGVFFLLF